MICNITVWIYVDTRYRVGHPDHIKAFADPEAAERWFKANDKEGVAFQYEVIGRGPSAVFAGREKAAGRDTVGFFLRLPARPPVPSRLRQACDSMVNERLTEVDGRSRPGEPSIGTRKFTYAAGRFRGIIRLSVEGLLRGASVL